ncbi:MAG: hypothetical protein GC136_02935 [Alphaproteobacteria bacterium]|nr:hypothetical protein [Alphaproteobacteria bacterium]
MRSSISSSSPPVTLALYIVVAALLYAASVAVWLSMPLSERNKENLFFAPLDNIERLEKHAGEKRIVLLGGSSMGLSVSAETLSKQLNRPVINLGVHAGIGYANLWDFYKPYLNKETDLIVLSPEYEFIKKTSRRSNEYCDVLFLSQNIQTLEKMPLGCWPNLAVKTGLNLIQLSLHQTHPKDVYFRTGFNAHGDMVSHLGLPNRRINARDIARFEPYDAKGLAQYEAFVRHEITGPGYKMLLVPVSISEDFCKDKEKILEMQQALVALSTAPAKPPVIDDLCLSRDYFFDTAYHMNLQGRPLKARAYLESLKRALQ